MHILVYTRIYTRMSFSLRVSTEEYMRKFCRLTKKTRWKAVYATESSKSPLDHGVVPCMVDPSGGREKY